MRDCADGNMRDLLPGYVHGTISAAERADVAAHLESCEDCAAEVELIEIASTAFPLPKIDIGSILKALPAAPRDARRGVRLWRIAAGIGIVAIGASAGVMLRGYFAPATQQTASATAPVVAPEIIAAAPTPSPEAVAAPIQSGSMAGRATVHTTGISFGGGLSDLTDDQLDTLLGELDDLEALPSTEPETHLSPIVPIVPEADGGHSAQ